MDFFGIEQDLAMKKKEKWKSNNMEISTNLIDEQYFGDLESHDCGNERSKYGNNDSIAFSAAQSQTDAFVIGMDARSAGAQFDESVNYVDQLYFGDLTEHKDQLRSPDPFISKVKRYGIDSQPSGRKPLKSFKRITKDNANAFATNEQSNIEASSCFHSLGEVVNEIRQRARINLSTGGCLDTDKLKEGQKQILDSAGFRIPHDSQLNFEHLTEEEAASVLLKAVIDVRDNIVVLNKPNGIASHPGPSQRYSVMELLPRIAYKLFSHPFSAAKDSDYQIVHRLDKDCSGLMIVSRNTDASLKLQEAFAKRWIKKDYLCIVVGVPGLDRGYLRLPIVSRNFNGVHKMCIHPLGQKMQTAEKPDSRLSDLDVPEVDSEDIWSELRPGHSGAPITRYEKLDRRNGASLLLCSTLSGIKHQIRVHLAMELGTPILGDHKYSHAAYLAPQRLPRRLCEVLGVRQPKVRHFALHLHASHIRFGPEKTKDYQAYGVPAGFFQFIQAGGSKSPGGLNLNAKPPDFFTDNMKRIGLQLPRYLSYLRIR